MIGFQAEVSKVTYESIATVAEALPDTKREEFATLLADLRNHLPTGSVRARAIQRWLRDAGWPVQ